MTLDIQIFPEPQKVTRNKQNQTLKQEAPRKQKELNQTDPVNVLQWVKCVCRFVSRRFCPIFAGRLWLLHKDSYRVFDPPPPLLWTQATLLGARLEQNSSPCSPGWGRDPFAPAPNPTPGPASAAGRSTWKIRKWTTGSPGVTPSPQGCPGGHNQGSSPYSPSVLKSVSTFLRWVCGPINGAVKLLDRINTPVLIK